MEQFTIKLKDKNAYKILESLEKMDAISMIKKNKSSEAEKQKQRHKIIQAFKEVELIQAGKLKGTTLNELIDELNEI